MAKIAFFVLGPESSGTKMTAEFLIRSTGAQGTYEDGQPFDDLNFEGREKTIVFRRSVPHGAIWYDSEELYQKMRKSGYRVKIVTTDRDTQYMVKSQVKHYHVRTDEEALNNIERARKDIAAFVDGKPHVDIRYEPFTTDARVRHLTYKALGIRAPEMDFYDGNAGY